MGEREDHKDFYTEETEGGVFDKIGAVESGGRRCHQNWTTRWVH